MRAIDGSGHSTHYHRLKGQSIPSRNTAVDSHVKDVFVMQSLSMRLYRQERVLFLDIGTSPVLFATF